VTDHRHAEGSAGHTAGIALCLTSAAGFGLMAIFAKEAYAAGVGLVTLLAIRFALAAGAFWAIVAARRVAVRRAPRGAVLAGLALGAIGCVAQAGGYFGALRHLDASLTALLLYTYPALVFLGAVRLGRERASAAKLAALGLALAGTLLVLAGGDIGALAPIGVLLALGAACVYATYILVSEPLTLRLDAFLLPALICTGAAGTFAVAGLAAGALDFGFGADGWALAAGLALFSTVLPIATFLGGLRRIGASSAAIVSAFEPVVTVGLAIAVLGESLGAGQLAGGALVLAAVVLLQRRAAPLASTAHEPPAAPAGPPPARPLAREAA
jgi:drug/metabolite transporter (DMT)-like permease